MITESQNCGPLKSANSLKSHYQYFRIVIKENWQKKKKKNSKILLEIQCYSKYFIKIIKP